ncbi:hypothetical protein FSP39_013913 [Pinctada imbricata]|uniref:SAM-dependent MTase TRM10-type domain-containing protein n=1 Tax=Pinctada imbricata TaxID=66713 RepID=A0AA88YDE3_PINIB|nr:hypothetical protein FSP39_013913 [Pinctada imbricata]
MVEAKAFLNCICTEKSYLDLFPKENLVYLTPDSENDLRYDHRDIYIVGAIVDLSFDHPVTLANAREMGLRHARIPVQKYCK